MQRIMLPLDRKLSGFEMTARPQAAKQAAGRAKDQRQKIKQARRQDDQWARRQPGINEMMSPA